MSIYDSLGLNTLSVNWSSKTTDVYMSAVQSYDSANGDQIYSAYSAANDVVLKAGSGNDQITGSGGNDTLDGGGGDDQITGSGGADIIDGGTGDDTAYFAGTRANYTINTNLVTGVTTASDNSAGSPDGFDTLTKVEHLHFTDQTVDVPQSPTAPVYSIADAGSVGEGGSLSFTVSRTTTGTAEDVTYTLGGTATSGSDYTAPTGTVHFAAGASTATVTIASLTDAVVEGPETVALTLGTASSGGSIDAAHKTGTGTITDTTGAPVYSIADAGSVGEGGSLSFTVSRTTTGTAEDVTYTLGGTATSGSDYTAPTGTVHFAAGASTATVTIASLTDAVVEGPETVALTLGTASSAAASMPPTRPAPAPSPIPPAPRSIRLPMPAASAKAAA